jgi:hypothetical protein
MDDEDEIIVNGEGLLDLRYRGWTSVDSTIWNLSERVQDLDISFNCLGSLPEEIGVLSQLHTLDCSCNQIEEFPRSISKLRRLKIFRGNGNKLKTLPQEIGDCRRIEIILLGENRIETLPTSIGQCLNLRELDLKNNHLVELPLTLAELSHSIEKINVSHNKNLLAIPAKIRDNTEVIMWILTIHYKHSKEINQIKRSKQEMGELCQSIKTDFTAVQNTIKRLELERKELLLERESIYRYLIARDFVQRLRNRSKLFLLNCKQLFDRRAAKIGHTSDRDDEWPQQTYPMQGQGAGTTTK